MLVEARRVDSEIKKKDGSIKVVNLKQPKKYVITVKVITIL